MNPANPQTYEQSRKMATRTILVIIGFVLLVAGVIGGLEAYASHLEREGVSQGYIQPSEPFYVLLIGNDSRKETAIYTGKGNEHAQVDQHTDIATLMRVDPYTYTITLITIPRDTYVDEMGDRLTGTLVSGNPEDSVKAAEIITGADISYYMMTTFNGFHNLIDALGGIEVDVPMTVTEKDPVTAKSVTVEEGEDQHLNGAKSLVFARSRKSYPTDQDALRQVNVRNIEQSMINVVLSRNGDLQQLLVDLKAATTTNMDYSLINYMIADFIAHKGDIKIYSCTGPYVGDENEQGLWVVDQDKETWARIIELANAGENPASVVASPTWSTSGNSKS